MVKETIYKTILISGIIPSTILIFFSFYGIFRFITDQFYNTQEFLFLSSYILGICGYVGLFRALIVKTKPILTILLLTFGLTGMSIIGGMDFWIWTFTIAEPDEWFIGGYPMIVTIIAIITNSYRILKSKWNRQ